MLEGEIRWRPNEEGSLQNLRLKLLLKPLTVKVHKRNYVANITSAMFNCQSGNASYLKMRHPSLNLLQTPASQQRITQLEQLVGKLTLELDIQKSLNLAELNSAEKRCVVETLRANYSDHKRLATQLTFDTTSNIETIPLLEALRQNVPEIHNSDQGVQYLSNDYISTLTDYGIEISLTHREHLWENGYAEGLIRTLKE